MHTTWLQDMLYKILIHYFLNPCQLSSFWPGMQPGTEPNMHILPLHSVKHDFAKQRFKCRIPSIFNNMDELIKTKIFSHSFIGYKIFVKNIFIYINSYDVNCNIPNCYICSNDQWNYLLFILFSSTCFCTHFIRHYVNHYNQKCFCCNYTYYFLYISFFLQLHI